MATRASSHPDPREQWFLFREPRTDLFHRHGHVVEVLDVVRGRALVNTVFTFPPRHWWLPVVALWTPPLVLHLGPSCDMRWIRRGAWVVTLPHAATELEGMWRIRRVVDGSYIRMYDRTREDGTTQSHGCLIANLGQRFRKATPPEVRRALQEWSRAIPEPPPVLHNMWRPPSERRTEFMIDDVLEEVFDAGPVESTVEEEPGRVEKPGDPAPSTWARLSKEEDDEGG